MNMNDLALSGKTVLIREDLNVPVRDGTVTSDSRIVAALPTIRQALDAGAGVMLMSHLGRPVEGEPDRQFSLAPVAAYLSAALGQPVPLIEDYLQNPPAISPGAVCLLENVRFNRGEKSDDEALAKQYAGLCDVFVMDAFGTAHRAQASTHGVARYAAQACAGPLLTAELTALGKALKNPQRPTVAIVGGAKVSTKLTVLETLSGQVDMLVPGGGIANTFIAAQGHNVGKSLYESDLVEAAGKLLQRSDQGGAKIVLPVDVAVGKTFDQDAEAVIRPVSEIAEDDLVLDVGPQTAAGYQALMQSAGTIVWNGPVGVFEFHNFAAGTEALGRAIAASPAFSIAGGGDTLAAVDQFGLADDISYISTGGGAFLEFLEGKKLPAVAVLEQGWAGDL